ncbi:MAG: hypothetical protein ACI8QZ_001819 [Chlamydiales bacterium]|jgi:hypothetical protein
MLQSCVSYTARELRPRDASQMMAVNEKDRMFIGATYQTDPGWQKSYLSQVVSEDNILPVEVHMQNLNPNVADRDFSFLIESESAVLRLANGTEIRQINVRDVIRKAEYSQFRSYCWGVLLIVPGVIVWASVSDANVALADDYRDKVLRNRRFPAGNETNVDKLLFFQPQASLKKLDLRDANLVIPVTRRGGGETGVLEERRIPLTRGN